MNCRRETMPESFWSTKIRRISPTTEPYSKNWDARYEPSHPSLRECSALGTSRLILIILDQGSGGFEGQEVLAQAMEVDVELRVLVLARSYDRNCYLQAMQSGALDYLEGPLGAAEIVCSP